MVVKKTLNVLCLKLFVSFFDLSSWLQSSLDSPPTSAVLRSHNQSLHFPRRQVLPRVASSVEMEAQGKGYHIHPGNTLEKQTVLVEHTVVPSGFQHTVH